MSTPVGAPLPATVVGRSVLTDHLVRLRLEAPGFVSTGVPDEWVALTVPGQFQNRYYTIRSVEADLLTLDVVVHDEGLVTGWAQTDCVGEVVGLGAPKGSFALPTDAQWMVLAGDLTGLPAIGRIVESLPSLRTHVLMEAPEDTRAAYPAAPAGDWFAPPSSDESALAARVRAFAWPEGPGYFWMAGESAQMRDIRRHVRHDLGFASSAYDVMGYWSSSRGRQRRAVDPGPIYARGKAAGKTDAEIWADYDAAREPVAGEPVAGEQGETP